MKIKEIIILSLIIGCGTSIMLYAFSDDDLYADQLRLQTDIRIEPDSLDLGLVKYSTEKTAIFTIENIGTHPLLIKDIQPSCGCTVADWDKHPVKPGEKATVTLLFKPNSLGRFMKSIDVVCNTPQRVHILKIVGRVEE